MTDANPQETSPRQALPWSNVYGVARSLLASGTLLTLLGNDTGSLFDPVLLGQPALSASMPILRLSLFALLPVAVGHWVAVAVLMVVISGWRPRVTGILHWWVAFSFAVSCTVVDGGDQIGASLAALLVPITLTDPRRSHWQLAVPEAAGLVPEIRRLVAVSTFFVLRVQVAVIYFQAAVSKFSVAEWVNGTAVYYWFTHGSFGLAEPLRFAIPMLSEPLVVATLTWGALGLEIALFSALVMQRRHWPKLLALGVGFHLAIAVVHGLTSFFFTMAAALVLYLRPSSLPFSGLASRAARPEGRQEGSHFFQNGSFAHKLSIVASKGISRYERAIARFEGDRPGSCAASQARRGGRGTEHGGLVAARASRWRIRAG